MFLGHLRVKVLDFVQWKEREDGGWRMEEREGKDVITWRGPGRGNLFIENNDNYDVRTRLRRSIL